MKNKTYRLIISAIFLTLIGLSTCKNKDLDIDSFEIKRESVVPTADSVSITGSYSFAGTVKRMKVNIGENESLIDANIYEIQMEGTDFSVTVGGLKPSTKYYYCYSINFGTNDAHLTETKSFTMLDAVAETPTVKTLEVLAIDSMTYRIKCEVVSDGGQEVTERGICWNTYGDPTMDDKIMQHANGGPGIYTIRMENLAFSTEYYVRAYAKSATGIGFGEELNFHTSGSTTLPKVSTVEISNVTYNTAQCLGNVSNDGGLEITERGVCWGLEPDPTVNVHHAVAEGAETGNFTVIIDSLSPNTTYHARCYATNEKGTAYGEELTFKTTEGMPTVTTGGITDITSTSAKGIGEVTDQGASAVTERGLCWSTGHEPTTSGSHASNGAGVGAYAVNMTSLTLNETYYVRAYATNGQGTSYGAEVSFTAQEGLPSVQTLEVTNVTHNSAKAHGKVTDQGGSTVSERGICWGIEPSPTIDDSHAHNGTGAGEFEISITNLGPGKTYYVRAYAKNTQGMTYGAEITFTTEATLPTVTTDGIEGTTAHGTVTTDGGKPVTERGICWSLNHNPTITDTHGDNGTGLGSYTVELTDLGPGKTYYYRAYAINSKGTAYGGEKSVTTEVNLPIVITGNVSNIGQNNAVGSGNVTTDGGATVTERGVCWSTSHNPTVSGSHATSGTGTGSFTVNMTNLTANTQYYVRAFAKNSAGIAYGAEVNFRTSQNISAPTVTTAQVTNIQQTTATGGGNVSDDGGALVTERGICWSTSHNPTTSSSHAGNGTGEGSYTINMTGLMAGTTYYVKAYAINSQGTSYGDEVSFSTQNGATLPTVVTIANGSMMGGNVIDDGGAEVTERGLCLSTQPNPTIYGEHFSSGSGLGEFFVDLPSLTPNTTYYARAYAINSVGTAYGGETSFIVPPQNYNIGISANPAEGGTVNGGGIYQQGQNCTVSATTNTGYTFANWTENGNVVSTEACYTFVVNADRNLVAHFEPYTYIIIATVAPTDGGTINGSGNFNQTYTYGETCTLTASPNEGFTFTNWTENGYAVSNDAIYSFMVNADHNLVANYNANPSWPNGVLPGYFSVSATQQVRFSQGNLQYKASTNAWRFAPTQYDYIGEGNTNISQTYNGWIDLFGWGTSGYSHGAVCYQPWSTSDVHSDYYAYGDWQYNLYDQTGQADWGYNSISNGGNTTDQWRTLTQPEWHYVFYTRSTTSGIRFAKANIDGVNGVILLPDDWNESTYYLSSTNTNDASYSSNTITASQWIALETAGAVFLPASGYRYWGTSVNEFGIKGYYWSASYCNSITAHIMHFGNSNLVTGDAMWRDWGYSVRLIYPAQ